LTNVTQPGVGYRVHTQLGESESSWKGVNFRKGSRTNRGQWQQAPTAEGDMRQDFERQWQRGGHHHVANDEAPSHERTYQGGLELE
jgi:hypothetical protein